MYAIAISESPLPQYSSIQLYPDGDFSQEMELDGWARNFQPESPGDPSSPQRNASSSKDTSPLHPSLPTPKVPGSHNDDSEDGSDTDTTKSDLTLRLQTLCITPNFRRYFGKSSGISFVSSAMSAKSKASNGESPGIDPEWRPQRRYDFWHIRPVSLRLLIIPFSHFPDQLALVGT